MSATPRDVSIIICAYTQLRWDDIVASVTSATDQPEAAEVILVIDHEETLLKRAQLRWPELSVIPNTERQGLSGARNTGVAAARGRIVAFLDDDAAAADDWLSWLVQPFTDPDVAAVGGRADPVWPHADAPRILPPELFWIVGCSYLGLPTTRSDVRNVIGCSMAFRREILINLGGFNVDTGRVGRVPLGCEETELCIKVHQADATARVVYEPRAVVRHRVSTDRTGWSYLIRRSFFEGISKAVLSRHLGSGDALASETSYTLRVLPRGIVRELGSIGRGGAARAAAIVLSLGAAGAGYLRGTLGHHSGTVLAPTPAHPAPSARVVETPSFITPNSAEAALMRSRETAR